MLNRILHIVLFISVLSYQNSYAIDETFAVQSIQTNNYRSYDLSELARLGDIPFNEVYHLSVDYELVEEEWLKLLKNFENLESIKISTYSENNNKKFDELIKNGIQSLPRLSSMQIYFDSLNTLPDFFSEELNLKSLVIGGNRVNVLSDFNQVLSTLEGLTIEVESIGQITNFFEPLKELERLIFRTDKIDSFAFSFEGLISLNYLEFSTNKNESLPNIWKGLPNLTKLHISGPELVSLGGTMEELINLETLRLINVYKLEELPQFIGKLPIYHLNISYAHSLRSLEPLYSADSIMYLYLLDLDLGTSLKVISKMRSLEVLTVSSKDIIKLNKKQLRKMKKIEVVIIDRVYKILEVEQYTLKYYDLTEDEKEKVLKLLPNAQY